MDKRRAFITLILVGLGIAAYVFSSLRSKRETIEIEVTESVFQDPSKTEISDDMKEDRRFPVYICGEVNAPGIYQIDGSAYLYEIIEMAGGLTDQAAVSHIDMVYRITQEESICIPSVEDISSDTGNESICFPSKEESEPNEKNGKVNINTADEKQLSSLSGIGEKTARKIIGYREENGPFVTTEDLMKVPGIGESKYAAVKDSICV